MRRLTALLFAILILAGSGALAEDFLLGVEPERTDIAPNYRSEHRPEHEACYWCTPMDLEDETGFFAALPTTEVALPNGFTCLLSLLMASSGCGFMPRIHSIRPSADTSSRLCRPLPRTLDGKWARLRQMRVG